MKNMCKRSITAVKAEAARVISIMIVILMLPGGFFIGAPEINGAYVYADSQTEGGYTYTVSGGQATITGYTGSSAILNIPSELGGSRVTAIGEECFRGNTRITRVTIPDGVSVIDDYAFETCSALREVSMPETVKNIGQAAFSGDGFLKNVAIPDSVEEIENGAFLFCRNLESFSGADGLKVMGEFVFAGCDSLTSADLSDSELKVLPDRTFCRCMVMENVYLPDTLEKVGKRAFSDCSNLKGLQFGSNLKYVGDYAFERCSDIREISFDTNCNQLKLGDKVFYTGYSETLHVILPDNTTVTAATFVGSGITGLYVSGSGQVNSPTDMVIKNGQIYEDEGATLAQVFTEVYDPLSGTWKSAMETVSEGDDSYTRYTIPDTVTRIGPNAFENKKVGNLVIPDSVTDIDDLGLFKGLISSVTLDLDNSSYLTEDGQLYEKTGDDSKRTLVRFFPKKLDENNKLTPVTVEIPDDFFGTRKQYSLPDNIAVIGPYAFCNAISVVVVSEQSALVALDDHSFSYSGIGDPRSDDPFQEFLSKLIIPDEIMGRLSIADTAFEYNMLFYYEEFSPDNNPFNDGSADTGETEDLDFNDRFARTDENGDFNYSDTGQSAEDAVVRYTSVSGNKSLYTDDKYKKYKVIPNSGYENWTNDYLEHNKDEIEFTSDLMLYTMVYKGEADYRSMVCVLNHDQYKTEYSIKNVGDDFAPMYTMMDHGLDAELMRGEIQEDIVLYSGITDERMAEIAGLSDKTQKPSIDQLKNAIGREFTDPAYMSTTTNPVIAGRFSSYSETMVVIYASKESLKKLGAVCIDSFSGSGAGEYEILFNRDARFKVLDVGTLTVGTADDEDQYERTYIRLKLMGDGEDTEPEQDKASAPALKIKPDYSKNLMRASWSKVKGAASYKLRYRKAGSSKWKTKNVKGTSAAVKGMKKGSAYQFKVAAVFSDGSIGKYSSVKSSLFSKTSGVKAKARKASAKVSWKKTKGAGGYEILVSSKKNMSKAKTVRVKGGKKTSRVIKGLKSGKRYYIAVRPYKKKGGKVYKGIRSSIRKVRIR